MKCEEALLLLSGHLDGQNTPDEEAALLQHLETCASCRALLQAYEAADQGVAQLEEEPPAQLLTGVMTRIDAERGGVVTPKKRRFFFGPGTAIAAVAAVLLLVLSTGDFQNLTQNKTSTADAGTNTQDVAPMAVDAPETPVAANTPMEAKIDAGPASGDTTVQTQPTDDQPQVNATIVTPKTETRGLVGETTDDMIDGVPHLIITENTEKPALSTITELQDLETLTDDAGGVWYVADAGIARAIAESYGETYVMEPYLLGEEAADTAVCVISVQ